MMESAIVDSELAGWAAIAEAEARGLKLASYSNAGLPKGKARLTFLPASCFKSEEADSHD